MKTRLVGALHNDFSMYLPRATTSLAKVMTWPEQYAMLDAYYTNNNLYETLYAAFSQYGFNNESIRGLRNPTNAVIAFYAAKLWSGRLDDVFDIETDNQAIIEPIKQVWEWSNWQTKKQEVARTFPKLGDMFLKVSTKLNEFSNSISRVYIESLPPQSVTKMDVDERGYLTYLRLDTPFVDKEEKTWTSTEVWNKETVTYTKWKHDRPSTTKVKDLPQPEIELDFIQAWGGDFIPVVWQGFRQTGGERGEAAIVPAIDKIDEANRMATNLHQNIFRYNRPTTIVGREGVDASGRPLPPITLGDSGKLVANTNPDEENLWILPGMTTVDSLVAKLDYANHLDAIDKQMDSIREDLPETIYSILHTIGGNPSSVSLQTLLLAAGDRLMEARQNAESALIRAHQIALSIGQFAGLFNGLGDYENGDFRHTFASREVWSRDELEKAQVMQTYSSAGVPVTVAAQRAGWSHEQIDELQVKVDEEQQQQQDLNAAKANSVLSQLRVNGNGVGNSRQPVLNGANGN